MGNANSGRRPDWRRWQQVAELRAQGLSLPEIGRRLGVSKQAVAHALARLKERGDRPPRFPVRCGRCDKLLWADVGTPQSGAVCCLKCLAAQPDVSFGSRLQAHRVAAKLTVEGLAGRAGVSPQTVYRLEGDRCCPDWPTLTRLVAVLGLRLLAVPPLRPAPRGRSW
jgi:transcriptional regulator with XRE-family HTH domain